MSEEKETIINGIDVSEEIRYCNNCSNLGLDFKIGKFYCSLSNRKDELPEILSCKNFSSNCYIKRLQEENKELKDRNTNLRLNLATYDLPETKKVLTDWRTGELDKKFKKLQKENEELKNRQITKNGFICDCEQNAKYKQALEEIRDIAEKLITETPEYNSCYYKDECGDNCTPKKQGKVEYCCYENVDKILTIINEVLNDRD